MEMDNSEREQLTNKLDEIKLEHRDLDEVIHRLMDDGTADQLMLKRLKKRKLVLKDIMIKLESKLIPDIEA